MTEKCYLTSTALQDTVTVLDCHPAEDGHYAVILDKTLFHPQGGGQPGDTGTIGDANVIQTAFMPEGIIHYTDAPVPAGEAVICVDAQKRLLHSRLHTGGHLLSHVMETLGWKPTKGHHWPDEGRIQYIPIGSPVIIDSEDVRQRCQQLIDADHKCHHYQDDDGLFQIRFADFEPYSCGGTHVQSLGEIGTIILKSQKTKKGVLSIQYDVT
ncbi:metal-dependent hydrolase [Morganella psychrotolerans]|uniref:Metal-dependent hydrolase n=1 Tax=Morganella psychrotolerans TaxID=368603 RepID=A0A1B8HKG1_9GAMM|nr:metal-dependent hydrolase [Morganella psychrotolerans]OBU09656.1 metal-dependent hydrolase [Morganella psychrotolerans]